MPLNNILCSRENFSVLKGTRTHKLLAKSFTDFLKGLALIILSGKLCIFLILESLLRLIFFNPINISLVVSVLSYKSFLQTLRSITASARPLPLLFGLQVIHLQLVRKNNPSTPGRHLLNAFWKPQ